MSANTPAAAELADIISRPARAAGRQPTHIDPLWLVRADSPSQPLPAVYEPAICVVVQGRKRALLAGETYHYDPLNYLVVSVTMPIVGQIVEASAKRPYL